MNPAELGVLDMYFPSFKRKHIGPERNPLSPKWDGLPKAVMQHHANKMIGPGDSPSAKAIYTFFLFTTGTQTQPKKRKLSDGSTLKYTIPRVPPPLKARRYDWMILSGPGRVYDEPRCLMQDGGCSTTPGLAVATPEQMEVIVSRNISDESWTLG